jgi:hypothetical protein
MALQELEKLKKGKALCSKSNTWHDDVVKLINERIGTDYEKETRLRVISLMPLEGHRRSSNGLGLRTTSS